jgi:hypothetical protein
VRTAILRKKVREVLAMAPARRFTEQMILDGVNELIADKAEMSEIRRAIDWNHESGYIEYKYNRDYDRDEWFLTERGKQKASNE